MARRLLRALVRLTALVTLAYVVYRLIRTDDEPAPAHDPTGGAVPETPPREPTPRRPRAGTTPGGARPPGAKPSQPHRPADASEPLTGGDPTPAPSAVRSIGVGEVPDHVPKWVEPHDDGSCPVSHPVKANLSSGIYHLPEGAHYERTRADRCYRDAEAAEADDLRRAKT